jgi:hypothetical protein
MSDWSRLHDEKLRVLEVLRDALSANVPDWRSDMPKKLRDENRRLFSDVEIDRMMAEEFAQVRAALQECVVILERAKTDAEITIALHTVREVSSTGWWLST